MTSKKDKLLGVSYITASILLMFIAVFGALGVNYFMKKSLETEVENGKTGEYFQSLRIIMAYWQGTGVLQVKG